MEIVAKRRNPVNIFTLRAVLRAMDWNLSQHGRILAKQRAI